MVEGKRLRAFRGAITVDEDTAEQIIEATQVLLEAVIERNSLELDEIVSIILTASPDLRSEFPAVGARRFGLVDIPLLCAQEIDVTDAQKRCIRCLIHAYSPLSRESVRHVYLREARSLRPDLEPGASEP